MVLEIDFRGNLYKGSIELFNKYYDGNLLETVLKVINLLDGEFAFSISDSENIIYANDYIGIRPLYYNSDDYSFNKKPNFKLLNPQYIVYNNELVKISKKEFKLDKSLEKLIKESIFKCVNDLDVIPIIFSGGVDSTLIAYLLKDYNVKLYAVGSENSKDLEYAKKIANDLNLPLKVAIVNEEIVLDNIFEVASVIGENNLMKLGVGMTIYLATKMIKEDGYNVAISGQGADELFAGYNRYLNSYKNESLQEELEFDIANMYHVNLLRDYEVSTLNNVDLRLPYLDEELVNFGLQISISDKIKSSDDKIRKHVLRDLAFDLGLDYEYAYRPKKAAQYGTGIDKILRKKVLKNINLDQYLKDLGY